MVVVYSLATCVGVLFFPSPGVFHSQESFPSRASAANTPTATTLEDVSHSGGRNVEGKES